LGRLKIFSGRQLCALLEQHGFAKVETIMAKSARAIMATASDPAMAG
jgi:hypothetical protein